MLYTTVSKDHTLNNDSFYNQSISLFGFVLNKLASMNFGVFIKTYCGVWLINPSVGLLFLDKKDDKLCDRNLVVV